MRLLLNLGIILGLTSAAPAEDFARWAVVAQEGNAAEAGRDAMRAGGNAIDAAVATALALAVTHPEAGNLGGGGFLVAYLAKRHEVVTVDFRERAPASATERMYLDDAGKLLHRHRAGPRAAGVPGTIRGLGLAHQRFGQARWPDLVRPAARLAREGFSISPSLARSLNAQLFQAAPADGAQDLGPDPDRLADFPASVACFRKPDGTPWVAGDRLVQPDLAATLDRIAAEGPDDFYKGQTARAIVDAMAPHGSLITAEDLNTYQAVLRAPIRSTYRGAEIFGMGPPSSGGIVVAQILNVLEHFNLKTDGPRDPRTLHRVAEAMRRAFHSRALVIADPDFVKVPIEELISKETATALARSIGEQATPSDSLRPSPLVQAEGDHTTHLSTIDAEGNAVALTYTLEQWFGSKAVVPGAGFLLNNEMGDFNLIPGQTDASGRIGTPPNRIVGGKRMLSSMSPTIVLQDGTVRIVTGSPGGRTIPNTTLWVLLNLLEFGLDPRSAVDAPRTHHAWLPDVLNLEGPSWPVETLEALRARGHTVRIFGVQGDAHTIIVNPPSGTRRAVADLRRLDARAAGD